MHTIKPKLEVAIRAVLIAVVLFNALVPVGVEARALLDANPSGKSATNPRPAENDINTGITLGADQFITTDNVPILSEELAMQAQVPTDPPLHIKLSAEPAIYVPGKPVVIKWELRGGSASEKAGLSIVAHPPDGVAPANAKDVPEPDGSVIISPNVDNGAIVWKVLDYAQLPLNFRFDLVIKGEVVNYTSIMVDIATRTVAPGGNITLQIPANSREDGTRIEGGKVQISVPANATTETLLMNVREPGPNALDGISLTWNPIEIIAVGKNTSRNITSFKNPITVKIQYDETQIFDWSESALTVYYYDPVQMDWFPMATQVDTVNNTLTFQSTHLTVFDYKANNWQSQSLPTVDSFKVSDFTGAATYGIDLWTPPGPGGLQPSLTLSYNSQIIDESSAFSQPSWVGMGWDLETGAVVRNMHGTDFATDGTDPTDDDTFFISAGGVSGLLLPISINGVTTTYNTADQSFMKVEFNSTTNTWTAWTKDGTKYIFSITAKTNKSSGCSTTLDITWRWSLTSITDVHNNILTYTYYTETKTGCSNQIAVYPDTITYPNSKYRIVFVRSTTARTDYQTSWTAAASRTLYGTKRLSEVQIQHNTGSWVTVKRYVLSFASNSATSNIIYPNFRWSQTGKTLTLLGVQEFGSTGTALPAVQFTYGDSMHVTKVDNGRGGQVQMIYERFNYFDDINKDLRALSTIFGNQECVYSGGAWTVGTAWTKASGTSVGCYTDGDSYLRVLTASGQRVIPENVTKPGGEYRIHIDGTVGPTKSTTGINWGFRETTTGRDVINYTSGVTDFSLEDSLEMPVDYDPLNTKLYLECDDCLITKFQFMLFPMIHRVTQRIVTIQPTNVVSTYTYRYDNGAPNTVDNSAAASAGNAALYTKTLREFRGHAMSQVINPEGLATVNWFYQTDALKGRLYDSLTLKQDFFDGLAALDAVNWIYSGSAPATIYQTDFDFAIKSINGNYTRSTASLSDGEVAVAHIRLSGTNAQGQVGLTNGGQFHGITLGSGSATADGVPLLSSGNFKLDEWYGVMFFVDANDASRVRIWQLDDPNNYGETTLPSMSGNWTFGESVTSGSFWLDSYFEGIPYSESITRYATTVQYNTIPTVTDPSTEATFPDLKVVWNTVTSTENRNYNGDAAFVGVKQDYTYASASQYGNLLTQIESGNDGSGWASYRKTNYEYYPNAVAPKYIVGLPARQTVLDASDGLLAETLYFYDNNTAYTSSPTKGDLTTTRAWAGGMEYSQASSTYDSYGNPLAQTVYTEFGTATTNPAASSEQTATTTYDSTGYHTYPVSIQNELGHLTLIDYNFAFGLPIQIIDPNNAVSEAAYDGFGRPSFIIAFHGDHGGGLPTLSITYHDALIPFRIELEQALDSSRSINIGRYYDGAGRQIQNKIVDTYVDGEQQQNVVVDFQYDSTGRLVKQTVPYQIGDEQPLFYNYNGQDFGNPFTSTTYDALGRVKTVIAPNGNATAYDYADLTSSVTDPKSNTTTSLMDIWGRVMLVDPPEGPDISYDYDVLNRLTDVTRDGHTTHIEYDVLGRKKNMTDPDMGFWQYQYDALGNLTLQTDNRGCALALDYDALNRLITRASSGDCGQQVNVAYDYDDTMNDNMGIGRRTSMVDGSGSTLWKYDERGRVIREDKVIDSQAFITSWSYNESDMPSQMTYPDGEVVYLNYLDGSGLPYGIMRNQDDGHYFNSFAYGFASYDEAGRMIKLERGRQYSNDPGSPYYNNGTAPLVQQFNYHDWTTADEGGSLQQISTVRTADSAILQQLNYHYDKNANVNSISDSLAGPQTQSFEYDSLNRITSASVTGGTNGLYSEGYEYDGNSGNLSLKGDAAYEYDDPAHIHAVTSLSNGNAYVYDANGNMTSRTVNGQTFDLAYDAENRLISVSTIPLPATSTPTLPAPTETPGATATGTPTLTPTQTETPTITFTPSETVTSSPTATDTETLTPQASETPTDTPVVTDTPTDTPEATFTATDTPTNTAEVSSTPTETPLATYTPSRTPTATRTSTVTLTPSRTPTASKTPTASRTPTPTRTPTASRTPTRTLTPSNTPTPTSTATYTPTRTPTRTPTFTPTVTSTITPMPSSGALTNVTFTYDGDGRRVKSVITTESGSSTTYYVGNYYELTGSNITKYYYLGAARVAMSVNGIVFFTLGDHLGSTSLVTDAIGNFTSQLGYTAWGETRYATGNMPTKYTYTGQYSHTADFGLMYYNARWYDPSLGRFAQADTIVPSGIQGYDRYAYANNNPIRYNDPSGHCSSHASLVPGISALVSCIKDVGEAISAYRAGERDIARLAATASGFDDWAKDAGARVNQLNTNVATVFSNAPFEKRLPASIDVGWWSVSNAGNIVGTAQLAKGVAAFTRGGSGGANYAVDGTEHMAPYVKGDSLFRIYRKGFPPDGYWTTPINPGNQITAIRKLALPPRNSAAMISEVKVTSYFNAKTSIANGLFDQPGGAFQILLPNLSNVTFAAGTRLPIGVMPITPSNFFSFFE